MKYSNAATLHSKSASTRPDARKFKAVNQLIRYRGAGAANHIAHVLFGQLVVRQIQGVKAFLLNFSAILIDSCALLTAMPTMMCAALSRSCGS